MFARIRIHHGPADERLASSTAELPGFTGMVELAPDHGPLTTLTLCDLTGHR